LKGTDHLRDLSIKENNAKMDVQEMLCVYVWSGVDCFGAVYVSVADTYAHDNEI
jgi:hypothetical protein